MRRRIHLITDIRVAKQKDQDGPVDVDTDAMSSPQLRISCTMYSGTWVAD
jgi:hypothetical protein